ncbi:MAG: 16S rRNA (uracil(1498)-N(3))-methyltransferase [Pyrinomonadaceae bacterium]|nr:16S rRNA (uracil(1498)-N(3))-methyltransferase [Acidobacteriota bacterium]MBK7933451.1 16S rRNA (uracil(1498)-N(3))-methyltransferase [Acidobacteriota bacterium]MBP7375637.1 16S rRNA (uracil(1498)-N(3))-methyltransferase [Pyrinomonadaceae bacterium]
MRRFYAPVKSFSESAVTLDEDETRHLRDVLRLTSGDNVSVFDGEGHEFQCSISNIGKRSSELEIIKKIEPAAPESFLQLSIVPTILNGEKYDLIVQKAVELGVSSLTPLTTIRSEVKSRDASKRLGRWRRIALEATKQCGRAKLMEIQEPIGFGEFIKKANINELLMFSERDGSGLATVTASRRMTAIFGPKGGWDDVELETARKHGITIATLGGRILRAETAMIAISAILQHRFGDIN